MIAKEERESLGKKALILTRCVAPQALRSRESSQGLKKEGEEAEEEKKKVTEERETNPGARRSRDRVLYV